MAPEIASLADLLAQTRTALREVVGELARAGVERFRGGHYDRGDALKWSRLDFAARRAAMEKALQHALGGQRIEQGILVTIRGHGVSGNRRVLMVCHGIPAALSVAAARELVGQPFLDDYRLASSRTDAPSGPVHLVACHRGVTEAQALRQLGFPDATVVSTTFGVYVADDVQKIQMVFLAGCRDEIATQARVTQFLRWLDEAEEANRFVERAHARGRIALAMARETTA
jgi:hypothetical protein